MSVKILASRTFRRKAKPLIKKYRSLKKELENLKVQLLANPRSGTMIGEDCYKIRLAVKSKGKGKSGGLRVITYVVIRIEEKETTEVVGLVTIFDKSDYVNISDKELEDALEDAKKEIDEEE